MTTDTVDSTSDERTANNVVRHKYRVLTEQEKAEMLAIKDMGAGFITLLHHVGSTDTEGDRMASANLTLAMRHIEDAVYRAVKHVTE